MTNKSIRLMTLFLLVGSAPLSATPVWAHECGSDLKLELGGNPGEYIIKASGVKSKYKVTQKPDPSVARITPEQQGNVTDGKFTVEAMGVGETTITIHWEAPDEGENGDCEFTVKVTRPPGVFSLVQNVCEAPPPLPDRPRRRQIYTNLSDTNFGVTIEATTTCRQEFVVLDPITGDVFGSQILEGEERTFELLVLSDTSIVMECTGSGTCSYRLGGFVTTGDISESCRFGPEPIYENKSDKDIAVTIEGTTSCQTQSFTVVAGGNSERDSGNVGDGGTRLFSFNLRPGESIMMLCNSVTGTGDCTYILAVKSGTPQSGQVSCGARKQKIYRNRNGRDIDVTVQVTAPCNGARLTLVGSADQETIEMGQTITRTFTVPPGDAIELDCSGPRRSGQGCSYTIVEGQ